MSNYDIDLIKALKQNEKPFGRMPEELRMKAQDIGYKEFETYVGGEDNKQWMEAQGLLVYRTYRLRPTYGKPETMECEIYENMHGDLCYKREGEKERVFTDAFIDTAFDGFIYKDTYQYERYMEPWLNLDKKMDGNHEVTHATHVLFQESK